MKEEANTNERQRRINDIDMGGYIICDWEIYYHGGTDRQPYIVLEIAGKSGKKYQVTADIVIVEENTTGDMKKEVKKDATRKSIKK